MKQQTKLGFMALILCLGLGFFVLALYYNFFKLIPDKGFTYIEYPEEISQVSKDSTRPSIMVAYQKGNTLYLGFYHKK
jgi:hypothetical protein